MKRKTIGIPGYKSENGFFGAGSDHLEFISKFGYARIIMPYEEFVNVDLLYLPGGLDLNPSSYNEVPGFKTTNQDVFKQFFFDKRLKNYIESGVSIFGVCLGFQELAAYFGVKLTQNLIYHPQSNGRTEEIHKVHLIDGNGRILADKKSTFSVNSFHHQSVLLKDVNDNIIPTLVSEGDEGIVEGFRHKSLNIYGVQYHPENIYDNYSKMCIEKLLNIREVAIA